MTDKPKDSGIDKDRLLEHDIVDQVQDLLKKLESGDASGARELISNLNEIREDSLYLEIGKLTRELHTELKSIEIGSKNDHRHNVTDKLSYVIELTEDAANKTMDGIENTIPVSNNLANEAKQLLEDWGRLKRREMSIEEFRELYKDMMAFLQSVEESANDIQRRLQDVLVAQNYQDLTGQAIKKVMHTVQSVEKRLLHLIALASEAGKLDGFQQDDSEEDDKKAGSEIVSGQDEVDDLLSSLGF